MSEVKQIYSIVNGAVADVLGSNALTARTTTDFVDLGRSLSDVAGGYDAFFGALACRITKTVEFVRLYEKNERRVMTDLLDFGAFVQKVYAELPDAVSNPVWSVSNGQNPPTISQADPYGITTTINITTKIFGKRGTWAIEIVRPTKQIKEAFLDASSMGAFIDAIYTTIENAYTIEVEALENLAVSTGIAECLENSKATNILAEYLTDNPNSTLTEDDCLMDVGFLAYANKKISQIRSYMQKPSKIFNVAGYSTFTSEDKCVTEVLTEFANASRFYLRSNAFNESLVALDKYNEVPYWQTPGKTFAFDDCSAIKITNFDVKHDTSNPPVAQTVTGGGIIAFVRDEEFVKAYFGERTTWELPNPRNKTVSHGEDAETGYAVDPHANAWVFYIANPAT